MKISAGVTCFDQMPDSAVVSIGDYTKLTGRSRASFYRDVEAGRLVLVKVGFSSRVRVGDVRRLLAEGAAMTTETKNATVNVARDLIAACGVRPDVCIPGLNALLTADETAGPLTQDRLLILGSEVMQLALKVATNDPRQELKLGPMMLDIGLCAARELAEILEVRRG